MENEVMDNQVVAPAPRHGFISFCLWFTIICCVITAIIAIAALADGQELESRAAALAENSQGEISYDTALNHGIAAMVVVIILVFVNIISSFLLLKRKKIGFKLAIYAGLTYLIYDIVHSLIMGVDIKPTLFVLSFYVIGFVIAIAILYGILHIRKNGVSYWSQLK